MRRLCQSDEDCPVIIFVLGRETVGTHVTAVRVCICWTIPWDLIWLRELPQTMARKSLRGVLYFKYKGLRTVEWEDQWVSPEAPPTAW